MKTTRLLLPALTIIVCNAFSGEPASPAPSQGNAQVTSVSINGAKLSAAERKDLESRTGAKLNPGDYWYDARCGAWGFIGGPAVGLTLPGMPVKAALPADASGGGTGVFINGRELHPQDVATLQKCTQVYPGRYWVDAAGNGGFENGPALFNLAALCNAAKKASVGAEDGVVYSQYGNTIVGDGIMGFNDHHGGGFTSGD